MRNVPMNILFKLRGCSTQALIIACTFWLLVGQPVSGQRTGSVSTSPEFGSIAAKIRGLLDHVRYQQAEEEARTVLRRMKSEGKEDSADEATILDLLVQALDNEGNATQPETIPLALRSVGIRERLFGSSSNEFAGGLSTLGVTLRLAGDFPAARHQFELAAEIREKIPGAEKDLAQTYYGLGTVLDLSGDFANALSLEERALAIQEKMLAPDDPDLAKTLAYVGNVLDSLNQFDRARSFEERALTIQEKILGPNHPDVASSLNNLGVLHHELADYTGAISLFQRSTRIFESTLGADHPKVGMPLYNLARVYLDLVDYPAAKTCWDRVLAIDEKRLGLNHPKVGQDLQALGSVYNAMNQYAMAQSLLERALEVQEKTLGPKHPSIATTLSLLGTVAQGIGDYPLAMSLQERALSMQESTLGPNDLYVANTLDNIASVLNEMGRGSEARPLYQRSLAIQEKSLGVEHPDLAFALNNLGRLLEDAGDFAGAETQYRRALAVVQGVPKQVETGRALRNLGQLLAVQGNYKVAEDYLHRALRHWEQVVGEAHPLWAHTSIILAAVEAKEGKTEVGLSHAIEAEKVARGELLLEIPTLPERQAIAAALTRVSGLSAAATILIDHLSYSQSATKAVWNAVIQSRALVLDEMGTRRRETEIQDREVRERAARFGAVRDRFARLVLRGPTTDAPEHYKQLLDESRHEKEVAERLLAEKSAVFRRQQRRREFGLDQVRAALPNNTSLVAFVRYERRTILELDLARVTETGASYAAFVLETSRKDPIVVPLGSAQKIDSLVAAWREQMVREATGTFGTSERANRRMGSRLREKLWDPIAIHVASAKRVFIVPDGAINLVNFGALPVGASSFLIERGPIMHYLSAERDLIVPDGQQSGKGLLIMGAPAFDRTDLFASLGGPISITNAAAKAFRGMRASCGKFETMRFEPLPASANELRDVEQLWRAAAVPPYDRLRGTRERNLILLQGGAANEAAFKQEAVGKRIVHLATHGFFLQDRCQSDFQSVDARASRLATVTEGQNPLLLTGLVLAGANHRQSAGPNEEDGILTAEEVAALNLDGVEWAVLSACDTGLGDIKAGEGVFGLRRAFQVAGARTIIMSLWPVDDQGTREWMHALYRNKFLLGEDTADSVRNASLSMLRKRRARGQSTHPFYWAGFVAAGDWR